MIQIGKAIGHGFNSRSSHNFKWKFLLINYLTKAAVKGLREVKALLYVIFYINHYPGVP